jgi:hypothetical protein
LATTSSSAANLTEAAYANYTTDAHSTHNIPNQTHNTADHTHNTPNHTLNTVNHHAHHAHNPHANHHAYHTHNTNNHQAHNTAAHNTSARNTDAHNNHAHLTSAQAYISNAPNGGYYITPPATPNAPSRTCPCCPPDCTIVTRHQARERAMILAAQLATEALPSPSPSRTATT